MRRCTRGKTNGRWRTIGEIEAAIGKAVIEYLQMTFGRGARAIRVFLHVDMVFVSLEGVMPECQQQLCVQESNAQLTDLLRRYRARMLTVNRDRISDALLDATGFRPRSMLHDLTESGEEMIVFLLEGVPVLGA
jgi:uncharacterized protein YbcI